MITVYVAAPYTGNEQSNVIDAVHAADRLAIDGFVPFVPHLFHYWDAMFPHAYETWMRMCLTWVERCDCVLRLNGESLGADREVMHAKVRGIPVFYSERELFNWRDALLAANAGSK